MKWIIYLTIFAFICFIWILVKAINDAHKDPLNGIMVKFDVSDFEPGEMFMENDFVDEHSPENLDLDNIDRALKIGRLKNKLNKIEKERETEIGDVNVDYQNYEGK